jgi:methyl-accepting chemotaxis protein
VSEPEAKKHVLDSIQLCRQALSALDSTDNSGIDKHRKSIGEVAELLESLKEKVFLKAKKALTPAFLVFEASQAVSDQAENLSDADDDMREFGEAVNQLTEDAAKLQGASKKHSLIVT